MSTNVMEYSKPMTISSDILQTYLWITVPLTVLTFVTAWVILVYVKGDRKKRRLGRNMHDIEKNKES